MKLLPLVTREVEKLVPFFNDKLLIFGYRKGLQELLLDQYLLQRFRDWLRPMPDGSLPNLDLRTEIYRLLEMVCSNL